MFAVVEFVNKSCAVIPYCWLFNNQEKCYWPSTKNEEQFKKLVQNCTPSNLTWPVYDIRKVIYTGEDYEVANMQLNSKLNASTTTDSEHCVETKMTSKRKMLNNSPHHLQDNHSSSKRSKSTTSDTYKNTISNENANDSNDYLDSQSVELIGALETREHEPASTSTITVSAGASSSTASDSVISSQYSVSNALPKIFNALEQLKHTQDQNSIMLSDILRQVKLQAITMMERPVNMPSLPINSTKEYRQLETFLLDEEHFSYVKRRLAAVGGTSVRIATTNMLKFLLTNKVARKFNWAGRDKKAFKRTQMMKVINEGILHLFQHGHPADMSEKTITTAVQDWLKLANQRYQYAKKKESATQEL